MSYSRRQLYAMGEPIGDSATRRKVDGGLVLGDGGGGGSAPERTTQVADLPEWAKGYAQETLAKGQALTDINQNRYQPYQGQRIAEFSPLQQQAFQGASNIQPSQLGSQAGQVAGAATLGALGTRYDPFRMGQFTANRAAQYMSPYMQNVVDRQKMEAFRASQLLGTQQQAQATQAGAFGGYREGLQRAERERGLRTQFDDIQAKGLQSAFEQAQQNFAREQQLREQSRQYGAGLGMQGFQTALQGAGQMGALGQQQFGQEKDILGLQSQFGAQQQQQQQAGLTQQYQDFMNQQRYPYQQLEFMSNLLRGTPMGTVSSLYQAPPSLGQQVGALGLGAYSASKMFAEGGSVTDDNFVASAISKLSDVQLQQELQDAAKEQDQGRLQLLQQEVSRRESMREGNTGISSLFSEQMADRVLPTEESMARGGIVAFAGDEGENDPRSGQLVSAGYAPGSPADYKYFLGAGRSLFEQLGQAPDLKVMTPEERRQYRADYIRQQQEGAGESPYKARLEGIGAERTALGQNLERAKGLGGLRAAAALLQGGSLARGIGQAGSAFADTYERAEAAQRAESRALKDMEFNLLDAQRKERMGLNRDAIAAMREVDRDRALAAKARNERLTAQANLAKGMAAASKPQRPTGSGAPKESKLPEQLAAAEIAFANDPSDANLRRVVGLRNAANYMGRQPGSERTEIGLTPLDIKAGDAATKARARAQITPEYLELKTEAERSAFLDRASETARQSYIRQHSAPRQAPGAGATTAPVSANSTPRTNPATVQGLPPGATIRGNEVYDSSGKLIGHVR